MPATSIDTAKEARRNLYDSGFAFFLAVLTAPIVSVLVTMLATWRGPLIELFFGPAINLIALYVFAALFFGVLGTLVFLGIAFRAAFELNRSRWAFVLAGGLAAAAHSTIGLVFVRFHIGIGIFVFGFLLESGHGPGHWGVYTLIAGAKFIGGLCAGGVFVSLSPIFRTPKSEVLN